MNCDVTLTSKEFSELHNALSEMHWLIQKQEDAEIGTAVKRVLRRKPED